MSFRPLHDRVLVRRIDADEKTAGGIIIPDTFRHRADREHFAKGYRKAALPET